MAPKSEEWSTEVETVRVQVRIGVTEDGAEIFNVGIAAPGQGVRRYAIPLDGAKELLEGMVEEGKRQDDEVMVQIVEQLIESLRRYRAGEHGARLGGDDWLDEGAQVNWPKEEP